MDTKTGRIRYLQENEKPKSNEIEVNQHVPDCPRCEGGGSVPIGQSTRAERRRAYKRGLPRTAQYIQCPDCNLEN